MKNNLFFLLIAIVSVIGCTKELDADEFTPCEDLNELVVTPSWSSSLHPGANIFEPMEPKEYNDFLIYSHGHEQSQIITKRNLITGEIVFEKNIEGLDGSNNILHNNEIIFVEYGRILSLNLDDFEIRVIWEFEIYPQATMDEGLAIIDNRLVFPIHELVSENNYQERLISIDLENGNSETLYQWPDTTERRPNVKNFKLYKNTNGEKIITLIYGNGPISFDYFETAKLESINLTTAEILMEVDLLPDSTKILEVNSFEIYHEQVNIELIEKTDFAISLSSIEYRSYNTNTGVALWTNEYDTDGRVLYFKTYDEDRNSITLLVGSSILEVNLISGELVNEKLNIQGFRSYNNIQRGSEIIFTLNNQIKIVDLDISCITKVIKIESVETELNPLEYYIFYNENRQEIYVYNQTNFLAIPYE